MQNYVIYDLTRPITSDTPVFPGDPAFQITQIHSIEKGSTYNLCSLHFGNHIGTHIDFPAHVIKGGKTSSDYTLDYLIGAGVIIEVPIDQDNIDQGISAKFIQSQNILTGDIVLFKTSNSKLSGDKISDKFVYLSENAANELINKKVKMVGIDYFSVDSLTEGNLPVHVKLLSNDILIIENLALENVPAGRYEEIGMIPLNIPGIDGLPVRAYARLIL